jgi:hypothetical protein
MDNDRRKLAEGVLTKPLGDPAARPFNRSTYAIIGGAWLTGAALIGAAAVTSRPAGAVPAFAEQTSQPCKACHVGGFGPELTPFGREFKLGGYTLRAKSSIPLSAMAVTSWTHTNKDQVPAPEHLDENDNIVLDQASLFVAGGLGSHFGGFAQITYDGVGRAWSWDNLDLRMVAPAKLFGEDTTLGLSINNNPTIEDPWNTMAGWGFPFTDTAVSQTPAASPLIDGGLAQEVLGFTAYSWIGHKFYLAGGGYGTPAHGTLDWLGADPDNPGKIHGLAPYARVAYQNDLAGGTFEAGGSFLKAAIFPGRDRSSGFSDHYTDWALDSSWQTSLHSGDVVSANFRYVHENGDLQASCALALIGDGSDVGCGHYHLNELRATLGYSWHGIIGADISPFSITGSRNFNVFGGNGLPDSNGVTMQLDYTPWGAGNSPLGPRFNTRLGLQYTLYGKFNGARHNFDLAGANASDNNALRAFLWVAF